MEEPPEISAGTPAPSPRPWTPPPIPFASRFAHQAAYASLIGPLLAIMINLARLGLHKQMDVATLATVNLIVGSVSGFLVLSSLILAIIALRMSGRSGNRGVVGSALGGLILSGMFVGIALVAIPVVNRLRARAKASSEAREAMRELQDGTKRELRGDKNVQP